MANENTQQQAEKNQRSFCTGNCLNCNFQQQVYCAAQHGHAIMGIMPNLFSRLETIEAAINKISSGMIQLTDKPFINPLKTDDATEEVAEKEDLVSEK